MLGLAHRRSRAKMPDAPLEVLVVSDGAQLEGIRRVLFRDRERWRLSYCSEIAEAAASLERRTVDVLVAGTDVSTADGRDILEFARVASPATARLRVTAQSDTDDLVRAAHAAHQVITTANGFDDVRNAIVRVAESREELPEQRLRAIVNWVDVLPTPSDVQRHLREVLARPHTLQDVAEVVETDVSLSTELLRLVNSSYFGLNHRVASVRDGVGLLGLDLVEATVAARSAFQLDHDLPIDVSKVNQHSQLVAAVAGYVATAGGASKQERSIAVSVGLLHDLGVLILAQVKPKGWESVADVLAQEDPDVERLALGADRFAVAAHLLDLWAFSEEIPSTIRSLYRPLREVGVGTVGWSVRVAHHAVLAHGVGLPAGVEDRDWFDQINDIERELLLGS